MFWKLQKPTCSFTFSYELLLNILKYIIFSIFLLLSLKFRLQTMYRRAVCNWFTDSNLQIARIAAHIVRLAILKLVGERFANCGPAFYIHSSLGCVSAGICMLFSASCGSHKCRLKLRYIQFTSSCQQSLISWIIFIQKSISQVMAFIKLYIKYY